MRYLFSGKSLVKALILSLFTVIVVSCSVQPKQKPNVIYILTDQWRASAFGYAGDPNVKTPRIDKFAKEAVNFTNAVSVAPVCDTPYTALDLNVPNTINTSCRQPNGFSHPMNNVVTYEFPKTKYTTDNFKWIWYDGPGAPPEHKDIKLPNNEKLPEQGAMFIGEKGNMLLPHWDYAKLIVNGKYEKIDFPEMQKNDHYHQFVDTCLGKTECSAPFSYAAKLTESILLGVIANRFPNETLHWDIEKGKFDEKGANKLLDAKYRKF